MGFDKQRSLEAFKTTVYPVLRANCFGGSCTAAGDRMLAAISAWRDAVADMVPEVPRGIEASKKITEQQVLDWIAADQAKAPAASREFIKYASFHTLHNAGVSALNLNHARVGLSKALNTTVHQHRSRSANHEKRDRYDAP